MAIIKNPSLTDGVIRNPYLSELEPPPRPASKPMPGVNILRNEPVPDHDPLDIAQRRHRGEQLSEYRTLVHVAAEGHELTTKQLDRLAVLQAVLGIGTTEFKRDVEHWQGITNCEASIPTEAQQQEQSKALAERTERLAVEIRNTEKSLAKLRSELALCNDERNIRVETLRELAGRRANAWRLTEDEDEVLDRLESQTRAISTRTIRASTPRVNYTPAT